VLEYRNTKLAVVEAKAWDEELTEGVAQAKNYAGKLAVRFAFATNGQGVYRIDMKEGAEGEVSCFPTPDELWKLTFAETNAWRDRFAAIAFEDRGGYFQGRYYQDIAIQRVLEAVAAGLQRILLTLATGTGKTFIAFQIAWKLFYIAYALPTLTREERAARAKVAISAEFNSKQQAFLDFVLAHYVSEGVRELDQEKLTPLLRLKYHDSIADAVADLGRPEEIGNFFAGFQKYLYQGAA
jgi:type I restriction enzyme, R subunit